MNITISGKAGSGKTLFLSNCIIQFLEKDGYTITQNEGEEESYTATHKTKQTITIQTTQESK